MASDDPTNVTVVPDSAVVRAGRPAALSDVPGTRRSRSLAVAAAIGIPVSLVFLFFAIRGADLGAVWSTLQNVKLVPVAGAVACMGAVYWLQAARWRRIADTRLGQRRFVEMVVAGVAVNNVLPGRVGDLLRARWVSRGAFSFGRGLATVVLDRGFDILALVTFLLVSLPLVTDEGWVDRIVVGSLLVLAALAVLLAAARWYTGAGLARGAPIAASRRRFARDTLEGLSDPLSVERGLVWFGISVAAWACVGRGGDPRRAGRRGRALPRRRALRDRGAQPRRRDPVLSGVRRHLPVAGRLGARALRHRSRGGSRVRDRDAGRLVRPDDHRGRGDPRLPRARLDRRVRPERSTTSSLEPAS